MPDHRELDGYSGPQLKEQNDYLRTRHGLGYMGFSNYRLVFSDFVTELSAGDWADWDENLSVELRGRIVAGETGRELCSEYFAERHKIEMRRIPKYCEFIDTPGFILEKWMGPAYFGTPAEWNSKVVEGTNLPMLGPYPHRGAYVSCLPPGVTPYPEAPTGPFLDRIIEQWEIMRNEMLALSAGAYIRKRTYEAENRDKLRSEKWNRESEQANMTALRPFFSTYLEGGKARQLAAEHAGLSSNYGN
jgi:hypothetical protein